MVSRFYGVFLLLAQCPRSLRSWENSIRTAILEDISVANQTIRSKRRLSSDINERPGKAPSVRQESPLRHFDGPRALYAGQARKKRHTRRSR